jgi:hypothetical protein
LKKERKLMSTEPELMTADKWETIEGAHKFAVRQGMSRVYIAAPVIPSLLAYHEQAQDALNYAYQLAGVVGAGVEALDNLSAVVHGEAPPHPWPVAESAELQRAEEIRRAAQNAFDQWSIHDRPNHLRTVAAMAILGEALGVNR